MADPRDVTHDKDTGRLIFPDTDKEILSKPFDKKREMQRGKRDTHHNDGVAESTKNKKPSL